MTNDMITPDEQLDAVGTAREKLAGIHGWTQCPKCQWWYWGSGYCDVDGSRLEAREKSGSGDRFRG